MRMYKPKPEPEENNQHIKRWQPIPLPTDKLAGIYARQSTKNQVIENQESADAQTKGLLTLAMQLGWQDSNLILYVENTAKDGKIRNASGRLRIDQREGLSALIERIEKDEIKVVFVTYEDRLFRDEDLIQVATFITICRAHTVLIITNRKPYGYNFADRNDRELFRMHCERAAAFIADYNERLSEYKSRVSERGQYDGRGVPIGYIVDYRKTIMQDGRERPNPTFKRYIPYPPHAAVIIWLFRRYRELGGNLPALCQEVRTKEVVFPPFEAGIDTRNLSRCGALAVEGGFRPTRLGITSILTNPVYIGCWVYHDMIMHEQNHEPIVDKDDFDYAFTRLSNWLLNGEENTKKPQVTRQAKPIPPSGTALLLQIIVGDIGPVYIVGTPRGINYYAVAEKDARYGVKYQTAHPVDDIDFLVVDKLIEHLETENQFDDYREHAEEAKRRIAQSCHLLKTQLAEADKRIAGLKKTLELSPDELDDDTRREFLRKLASAKKTREEVDKELQKVQATDGTAQLLAYHELIKELPEHWHNLPFADRKRLVEAFASQVILSSCAPHWLRIDIVWKMPSWGTDCALIWRTEGGSTGWTEEENTVLREQYTTTNRQTLVELLPRRSWKAIHYQATRILKLPGNTEKYTLVIPRTITYEDHMFMQEQGITYDAGWSCKEVFWSER